MDRFLKLMFFIGIGVLVGYMIFGDGLEMFETEPRAASPTRIPTEEAVYEEDDEVEFVSNEPARQPYYPLEDCVASRLYVGDRAYVSLGGGSNGIRTEPDTHPADNIIYRAPSGEGMWIIDGPVCNYGWILWKVETDTRHVGWTPETKDGVEFWLVPVESQGDMVRDLRQNDPERYEVYQETSRIMGDSRLSESEKHERIRMLQDSFGEEVVAWAVRLSPVYDKDDRRFQSFDSYARDFVDEYGGSPSGNAPIDKGPVGATLDMLLNPDHIEENLGLDDWLP